MYIYNCKEWLSMYVHCTHNNTRVYSYSIPVLSSTMLVAMLLLSSSSDSSSSSNRELPSAVSELILIESPSLLLLQLLSSYSSYKPTKITFYNNLLIFMNINYYTCSFTWITNLYNGHTHLVNFSVWPFSFSCHDVVLTGDTF